MFYPDSSKLFVLPGVTKTLNTQRDSNSLSNNLDALLLAPKTTNGFDLFPFALATNYMLTIHFSYSVVFKQTDFTPCLSIVVLDTIPFQTDVSSIAILFEGGYLYLIEYLPA